METFMKNRQFALPLIMVAGLLFGGAAFADNHAPKTHLGSVRLTQVTSLCDMEHASDVCILNHSGQIAYVSIEEFGVDKDQVNSSEDLMDDYYSDEEMSSMHVTIYNADMEAVFDEYVPNHGPILELVSEKANSKKFAVKFR
jgi:hypothetical protein